jgi:hypothetical protein
MKRALFVLVVAALVLPACGGTDRPEGVVERWLVSLNQGKAGEPEKYAPDVLSQRILPNWQSRDPGALDVIEVGKGRPSDVEAVTYDVPFRVAEVNGSEVSLIARVFRHSMRGVDRGILEFPIVELVAYDAGRQAVLPLPSEGGDRIGDASPKVWLAAVGIAVALILLSVLLMSTVGREARVSS